MIKNSIAVELVSSSEKNGYARLVDGDATYVAYKADRFMYVYTPQLRIEIRKSSAHILEELVNQLKEGMSSKSMDCKFAPGFMLMMPVNWHLKLFSKEDLRYHANVISMQSK